MVALTDVIASNERIASTFPQGLVAVFVGGTSGVGEFTLKKFAKYCPKFRAYIVGRSHEAAARIIDDCKRINSNVEFEFIKADVSTLEVVDDVCQKIKNKETAINLLFQTQANMAFKRSKLTRRTLCGYCVANCSKCRLTAIRLPRDLSRTPECALS